MKKFANEEETILLQNGLYPLYQFEYVIVSLSIVLRHLVDQMRSSLAFINRIAAKIILAPM